jgi:hypothetical protein
MIRCQDATIESDGSLQVVALGLNQLDIDVSAEGVTIGPRGVSAEVGISGCHNLIVYKQGDLRLSVHGFSDGVVAMTHDVVFVCSELELASGAISEALMLLSNRSKGDN